MKRLSPFLLLALLMVGVLVYATGLKPVTASGSKLAAQTSTETRGALGQSVTVQAATRGTPWINLRDGRSAPVEYQASVRTMQAMASDEARGVALASADFDEDGVADLVAGYAIQDGGSISLQRGDADAIFPNSPEALAHREEFRATSKSQPSGAELQSPFFTQARMFELPVGPKLMGAGDFDGDGHADIIATEPGSNQLALLAGDGHGGFAEAKTIALPGSVTAMVTGDVNRIDGLADILVTVNSAQGPKLLLFEGETGALKAEPEVIALPAAARAIATGQLDDEYPIDIAVAAGRDLLIIHGRDRKPRAGFTPLAQPTVLRQPMAFTISSLAVGDFIGDRLNDIALLADDGACHLLSKSAAPGGSSRWREASAVRLPVAAKADSATASLALLPLRVSSSTKDDLLFFDRRNRQMQFLINDSVVDGKGDANVFAASSVHIAAALDVEGEPVAALGMRLNTDALNDIVLLRKNATAPSVIISSVTATFTVINTNDSGAGSLRQAIISANGSAGADTINFAIPGAGTKTINLLTALPTLTQATTIDGTTQSPGSSTPPIELNGAGAGAGVTGLTVGVGNSTIRGLTINRYDGDALSCSGNNVIIEGCFIGTNAAGTAAQANGGSGIVNNSGSTHTVGGTTSAARNVISGNVGIGVIIIGPASGNIIQGNRIGTDVNGTAGIGNQSDGIEILSAASSVINTTIGGLVAGAGNLISANEGNGVQLFSIGTGNLLQGNLIGTKANGTTVLGNNSSGVTLFEGASNTIGGSSAGAGNVISGNSAGGVHLVSATTTSNIVAGNKIGTGSDGVTSVPNQSDGIAITSSASNNTIGGAAGSGNTIAFNNGAGVFVETGTGNAIQSNSIFSNSGLGIDLAPTGVTGNDAGDGDSGPNNLQNFPVLTTSQSAAGGGTSVQGSLNSTASSTFTLHFYASASCDASGNGEGATLLGSSPVTTNASGNVTFNLTLATAASVGQSITATATNAAGSTSEFSACIVYGAADLALTHSASPGTAVVGSNVTYTLTVTNNGPDAANTISVTDTLPAAVTFQSCNAPGGNCTGIGNNRTITFSSIAANASATITIVARVNCGTANGTNATANASVSSPVRDTAGGNNSASASFTVSNPPTVLTPSSESFSSSGGSAVVAVTFPSGCGWTAVSNAPWITITAGSLGNGNGTVQYQVGINSTGSPRMGTMTIAGATFTVNQSNQPCAYTLMPTSNTFDSNGGNGSFTVTTQAGCFWKATSDANWILVVSGSETGSGTTTYTVEPNSSSLTRVGHILVANQTFTITQTGVPCTYSLAPTSALFSEIGIESVFTISCPEGCPWTVSTNDSWITLTGDTEGVGPATVSYAVRDNLTGSARQGMITVTGQTLTVVQDAGLLGDCIYTLSPTSASYSAAGGNGSILIVSEERCAWGATVDHPEWVTFTSTYVGIGTGTITYHVAPNPGGSGRSAVITIAGQTFAVKQKGG